MHHPSDRPLFTLSDPPPSDRKRSNRKPSDRKPSDRKPSDRRASRRGPAEDFEVTDDSQTREIDRRTVSLFGHRHALKLLGMFMVAMFVTVIVAQVAC
jgi:hypothetical protein